MKLPLTRRNAMRAIMTAKSAKQLQDVIDQLAEIPNVDRGLFDMASMRLTTLENKPEKFQ